MEFIRNLRTRSVEASVSFAAAAIVLEQVLGLITGPNRRLK